MTVRYRLRESLETDSGRQRLDDLPLVRPPLILEFLSTADYFVRLSDMVVLRDTFRYYSETSISESLIMSR